MNSGGAAHQPPLKHPALIVSNMSPAKHVQSTTARTLIENYLQDLSDDDALHVLRAMKRQFQWAGTVMTRGDIDHAVDNHCLAENLTITDSVKDQWIDRVVNSWEWRNMDGIMSEQAWPHIDTAVHDTAPADPPDTAV